MTAARDQANHKDHEDQRVHKGHQDHLAGLNDEQRDAVTTTEGPILILAGAGSGKTRVITHRIAYLIESCSVRPEQVLAVTFTNKAAGEMKERVEGLLKGYYAQETRTGSPLISTFHSLCVRMLRRDIEKLGLGFTRSFTIYDQDDQERLMKVVLRDIGADEKQARATRSLVSAAKNRGEEPRDDVTTRALEVYQRRLTASNALDFDDLLIYAVSLLRKSKEAREWYHNRFRHVMVDEFQDTNGLQYSLVRLIVEGDGLPEKHDERWKGRSLCVVGDESQSIYRWRGSDFKIILGFRKEFPEARVIKLEENYRSTRRILDAANAVIANNTQRFDKNLRTSRSEGAKIGYAQLFSGEDEAAWVLSRISEHLRRDPDARAAVLYRTNAQSRLFEEACRRAGVRYNLVGGFSFYDRLEIKDAIAYLKLALNQDDSISLLRIINSPARGIGRSTLEELDRRATELKVSHWEAIATILEKNLMPARAHLALSSFREIMTKLIERVRTPEEPLSEIVKAAILDTGYERALKEEENEEAQARLQNLEELVNAAAEAEEKGEDIRDFIDHASLVSDTDDYTGAAQVTLLTMHSAKGLEFSVIFIAGLEDGMFPHSRSEGDREELEEERRLYYVAITRAKSHLYLSHAKKRRVFGEERLAEPSMFLNEVPPELIDNVSPGTSWLGYRDLSRNRERKPFVGRTYNRVEDLKDFFKAKSDKGQGSATGLKAGTRVRHAKYGQGLIVNVEGEGDQTKLTISFPGYGLKKMIEKYAELTREKEK